MEASNIIISVISVFFLTSLLAFAGCSDTGFATDGTDFDPGQTYDARVIRVADGDTIVVQLPRGNEERVRVLGVDCPETDLSANVPGEYPGIDDPSHLALWGERARQFTSNTLDGTSITLQFDSQAGIRDRYDRLLAYVILQDDRDLGRMLIENGMARVYTGEDFARKAGYLAAEKAAKTGGTGLWNSEGDLLVSITPVPIDTPTSGVFIASVHYNAAGDDRENVNDEYLVIANAGPGEHDLTGWTLSGPTQIPFVFSPFLLAPGGEVVVHTGSGIDSGTDLFRDLSSPALGNQGGRLDLSDSEGSVVSSFSWGTAARG
ncbi:MAG: hypothetical protein APR55_07210 [Methanolinea sp. SDB]|nr:MAG: hypothetical protein APR55_07210 [Methanolinea sp. SDB]